ncbi:hypothetical protein TW65_00017 [Stemphylium lycopersici]|nr:hypothetical protein TW65_00017 [Stemphylium lycopersici]
MTECAETAIPFEQGVNPGEPRPSKKRKQSSGHTAPIQATPKRSARRTGSASAGGLASPPPTLPHDDQEEEEEEEEEDGGNGGVEEEQELPDLPSSPIPIVSPVVHVRWRACFGDMEKNAIIYPARQLKRDRAIKALRKGDLDDWYALKELVKAIDEAANEYIHVDFDLMLAEELNEAPRAGIISADARARPLLVAARDGVAIRKSPTYQQQYHRDLGKGYTQQSSNLRRPNR